MPFIPEQGGSGTPPGGGGGGGGGGAAAATYLQKIEKAGGAALLRARTREALRREGSEKPVYTSFQVTGIGPVNFPALRIPTDGVIEIRALTNNTQNAYVSRFPTSPKTAADRIILHPTDLPAYLSALVLSEFWLQTDVGGEGVQVIVRRA